MVLQRVRPSIIAKKFGLAVSTVHSYKSRFKEEGMKIPPVGRSRPTNNNVADPNPSKKTEIDQNPESAEIHLVTTEDPTEYFEYTVNGVSVRIAGKKAKVVVNPDFIKIEFNKS